MTIFSSCSKYQEASRSKQQFLMVPAMPRRRRGLGDRSWGRMVWRMEIGLVFLGDDLGGWCNFITNCRPCCVCFFLLHGFGCDGLDDVYVWLFYVGFNHSMCLDASNRIKYRFV